MIRELLSSDSPLSSMRLMAFISLMCGCSLAAYGIYMGRDLIGLSALCAVFVGAAFGGKISQKITESRGPGVP